MPTRIHAIDFCDGTGETLRDIWIGRGSGGPVSAARQLAYQWIGRVCFVMRDTGQSDESSDTTGSEKFVGCIPS